MQPVIKQLDKYAVDRPDSTLTITVTGKIIADDDKLPLSGVIIRTPDMERKLTGKVILS